MIWTKQNFKYAYPFLDDLKIHVASSNYGTLSTIQLNITGEKFKYSNLPLIVKRLKKAQKSSELAVNLLDILGHEAVLKQVYKELTALGNIEFLKLDATQITPDITALKTLKGLIISRGWTCDRPRPPAPALPASPRGRARRWRPPASRPPRSRRRCRASPACWCARR